jgi:hypothetical protein
MPKRPSSIPAFRGKLRVREDRLANAWSSTFEPAAGLHYRGFAPLQHAATADTSSQDSRC